MGRLADPRLLIDTAIAAALVLWVEWIILVAPELGTPIAGRRWLVAPIALVVAASLAVRRRRPLLVWSLLVGGMAVQALATSNSPEGLELIFALTLGIFTAAAYSTRPRAMVALCLGAAAYAVYAFENRDFRSGRSADVWATSFFAALLVTVWLLGLFVHSRQEARGLEERAAEAAADRELAVRQERGRMARELHDIVSHSLSVVVAQAAGSRAQGETDPATLEKIESSGREALVEMRRLLGVLRDREDVRPDLEPQPGLADLPQLVERVRAAGLPVELSIPPDHRNLSPAIELAAFRIVQEALTNTLRHAGPAQARVVVSRGPGVLLIDVTDDGQASRGTTQRQGQGLVGMIERVALFGGELRTGPGAGGGFAVHAKLPTGEVAP